MEASEDELSYAEAGAEEEDEEDEEDDDDDFASLGNNPVVSEYEALIQKLLVYTIQGHYYIAVCFLSGH